MMGIGNLTELTEADTSGINAVLFGIAAELRRAAVLTTQVSAHARRGRARGRLGAAHHARGALAAACCQGAERPADDGARQASVPPTRRRRSPRSRARCATRTSACRCPRRACTSTTATACAWRSDPFALWPQLGLEHDAAHAFYMGVELARAQIAWQLGKRYVQDQPLDWGCAVEGAAEDRCAARGARAPRKRARGAVAPGRAAELIYETVVTTRSPAGGCTSRRWASRYRATAGADALPALDHARQHPRHRPRGAQLHRRARVRRLRHRPARLAHRRARRRRGVRLAWRWGTWRCDWSSSATTRSAPACAGPRARGRARALPRLQPRAGRGAGRRRAGEPAAPAAGREDRRRDALPADRDREDRRRGGAGSLGTGCRRRSPRHRAQAARRCGDAPAGERARCRRGAGGRRGGRRPHRPEGACRGALGALRRRASRPSCARCASARACASARPPASGAASGARPSLDAGRRWRRAAWTT